MFTDAKAPVERHVPGRDGSKTMTRYGTVVLSGGSQRDPDLNDLVIDASYSPPVCDHAITIIYYHPYSISQSPRLYDSSGRPVGHEFFGVLVIRYYSRMFTFVRI